MLAHSITKKARKELDETAALGLAALEMRSTDDYQAVKASRPSPVSRGMSLLTRRLDARWWYRPTTVSRRRLRRPRCPRASDCPDSVAVGLVIVEGPTAALQFSATERTTVVAETQNGLSWLGARHPTTPVTWRWDIDVLRLDVAANAPAADNESRFRDPALAALGFGAGHAGARAYAEDLRTRLGTNWAYVAFITKYPVNHFAYAFLGGPHLVMDYANDGWGPANIDRVFAHETGHIFNAPDEYSSSGCNCGGSWGYYGKPNANCQSCAAGGGVDCIMRANTWAMCPHTPWHLGFPMCPSRLGVQFRGAVPASTTRRWFTHSWPADCHVEWTVVPTTVRAGAPQIQLGRPRRAGKYRLRHLLDLDHQPHGGPGRHRGPIRRARLHLTRSRRRNASRSAIPRNCRPERHAAGLHVQLGRNPARHLVRHANHPASRGPQLDWDTQVERASADRITYWIIVRNLTSSAVDYEMRYAVLN